MLAHCYADYIPSQNSAEEIVMIDISIEGLKKIIGRVEDIETKLSLLRLQNPTVFVEVGVRRFWGISSSTERFVFKLSETCALMPLISDSLSQGGGRVEDLNPVFLKENRLFGRIVGTSLVRMDNDLEEVVGYAIATDPNLTFKERPELSDRIYALESAARRRDQSATLAASDRLLDDKSLGRVRGCSCQLIVELAARAWYLARNKGAFTESIDCTHR